MRESEIKFFEDMLKTRKKQIEKNIIDAQNEMDGLKDVELKDEADAASVNTDRLIEQAISTQQSKELAEIKYSLSKIANKTYGICEMCEELIGNARLKVKPHAKYCIVCREIVENSSQKG